MRNRPFAKDSKTVIILSKTRLRNSECCIGGLTLDGRHVRILTEDGKNYPKDTDLDIKQTWEIEFIEKPDNSAPHIEDILVLNRVSKESLENSTVKDFIQKLEIPIPIPIWEGPPDNLFDKLIQWKPRGSGYIDENGGIPNHSVGFWISDRDLRRTTEIYEGELDKIIRYQYPSEGNKRSLKFKGFQEPVESIPAGTLIRVSLARWWTPDPSNESEKCYLQLSGWYDLETLSQ